MNEEAMQYALYTQHFKLSVKKDESVTSAIHNARMNVFNDNVHQEETQYVQFKI